MPVKFPSMFPTKPPQLARALAILWCAQAAALVGVFCVVFFGFMPAAVAFFQAIPVLLGLFLSCMLLLALAERRNWARILFLMYAAYSGVITALNVVPNAQRTPLNTAFDIVLLVATIYGLVLLVGRESNSWFRPPGQSALSLGGWIRRSALTALALCALWLGLILTLFFHDPGMALIAFTMDAYPRIPTSVAGAFLRFAPYDPNGTMWTGQPLFKAACAGFGLVGTDRRNSIMTIRMLAAKGANVDIRENGFTALHEAVLSFPSDRDPELIRTLLELRANPALRIAKPGHRWNGLNAIEFARALDEKTPERRDPIIALLRGPGI